MNVDSTYYGIKNFYAEFEMLVKYLLGGTAKETDYESRYKNFHPVKKLTPLWGNHIQDLIYVLVHTTYSIVLLAFIIKIQHIVIHLS